MTTIQDILSELHETVASKGCLLILHDGTVVAHSLEDALEPDMVSGLTSFLTSTLNRGLSEGSMGGFSNFNIHSTHGKVLVIDLGDAFLVVLTNQFGGLKADMPEIQEATRELRRLSRISI